MAYVSASTDGSANADALDFCLQKAHFLQKIPYHQCGIALRKEGVSQEESKSGASAAGAGIETVDIRKFTSLMELLMKNT